MRFTVTDASLESNSISTTAKGNPTVDAAQLLIAPEVRRHLGHQATADLAARIQPSGDCVICHATLTDSQVSVTVHHAATDRMLVTPAHASCQPSSLILHPAGRRPAPPPSEYHFTAFVMPVVDGTLPSPRNSDVRGIPAILVNPHVDVQIGDVVEGRWRAWWQEQPELIGLDQLSPDQQLPETGTPTWAVHLRCERGRDLLTLQGPMLQYQMADLDKRFLDGLRRARSCLVLFCDVVPAGPIVDGTKLIEAAQEGALYGAWAILGGTPAPISLPEPEHREPSSLMPPWAQQVNSAADLERAMEDLDVCTRAAFSDDPALRTPWTIPEHPADPLPVLLLEPRQMIGMARGDTGVNTEARVEVMIGSGLHRLDDLDHTPAEARDWRARPIPGGVELLNPFGQVVATGKVSIPNRWREQANLTGQIGVLFGPLIGVRSPEGRPYDDIDRHQELQSSCRRGFTAAGLVIWADTRFPTAAPRDDGSSPGLPHRGHDLDDQALAAERLQRVRKFTVTVADTLSTLIPQDQLSRWLTHLWPVNCQTCAFALGTKADINIDPVKGRNELIVTMHHATCRPSGTPGVAVTAATSSLVVDYLSDGDQTEPSDTDLPVAVINPSCEHLVLRRTTDGWQNITLDRFKRLRFAPPTGQFPRPARHASVQLSQDRLAISTSGRRADRTTWSLRGCPEHIREQIQRAGGVAVALTTATLPSRLGHADLPSAFTDPASLIAWVRLRKS